MSSEKNKVVLKKIKDSTHILHPDSKLVLQSSKERIVIGIYVDNEILPLNEDSIELCDKWSFKYDKTFLKSDDDDEDEEEDSKEESIEDNTGDSEEDNKEEVKDDTKEDPDNVVETKEDEDAVVETKEDIKEDTVKKSDNVEPLLLKFGEDFSKLHLDLLNNVSKYEQQYLRKIEELEINLKSRDNELAELKVQHDKLRDKFKKMMSEFIENV